MTTTDVAAPRHALIVFARAPELGCVKTRLAAELGAEAALFIYRTLAERVISAVRAATSYSSRVVFTPERAEPMMREWLGPSVDLQAQAPGDLGERMAASIADAISAGAERVAVIGTDCPDVTVSVVEEAFTRLDAADVVLGPASDGGYYLIGMSRIHSALFADVPWSCPDTLRVTLERARACGLSVALLAERRDIDAAADWRAWLASADQPAGPAR
ncbi:MAG: TIGR04282 family arsenosugar biosynthesis glycosyltransferase [Gemmatimonadaceae bacterium]